MSDSGLTHGHLLGGRITYAQPASGNRSGIEPVLLAAAVPARPGQRVLEAGCGAGAGMLCLTARVSDLRGVALERSPALAAVAAINLAANDVVGVEAMAGDVTADAALGQFHHAFANPPWHPQEATPSPDADRDLARRLPRGVEHAWVIGLAGRLLSRGSLSLILPAARLQAWMETLQPAGCGSVLLLPLWPRRGIAAKLILLQAIKGGRGPSHLHPGLVLHEPDGTFTEAARAILRDGAPIGRVACPAT